MIFIYVFYIDVFLEQNFLMNLIVLSLTCVFCKSAVKYLKLRMTAAAFLGAVLSLLCYLVLPWYAGAVAALAFLVIPLMLLLAFGFGGVRMFVIRTGVSWLSIILLNGVVTAVYNLTGVRSLHVYIGVLVLFAARILVRMLLSSVRMQKRQMQLTLTYHGRSVTCMGLYDSGNLLKIPDSGEPVHIIHPVLLEHVLHGEEPEFQMIPYHALGTSEGTIYVCRLDRLRLDDADNPKIMDNPWVGRAQPGLLRGKPYQVILNSDVVDN